MKSALTLIFFNFYISFAYGQGILDSLRNKVFCEKVIQNSTQHFVILDTIYSDSSFVINFTRTNDRISDLCFTNNSKIDTTLLNSILYANRDFELKLLNEYNYYRYIDRNYFIHSTFHRNKYPCSPREECLTDQIIYRNNKYSVYRNCYKMFLVVKFKEPAFFYSSNKIFIIPWMRNTPIEHYCDN